MIARLTLPLFSILAVPRPAPQAPVVHGEHVAAEPASAGSAATLPLRPAMLFALVIAFVVATNAPLLIDAIWPR